MQIDLIDLLLIVYLELIHDGYKNSSFLSKALFNINSFETFSYKPLLLFIAIGFRFSFLKISGIGIRADSAYKV